MSARPVRPDLAEITTRHQPDQWELCIACVSPEGLNGYPWPCEAYEAAAFARALEQDAAGLRETLESMVNQFAYPNVVKGQPAICTGGLSALEEAFDVLGLDDPHILGAAS